MQRGWAACLRVSAYKAHSGWEGWKQGAIPVVLAGDGRQTKGKDAHVFVRPSRVQSVHREPVRARGTDTSSGSCRGKKTPAGEKVERPGRRDGGEGTRARRGPRDQRPQTGRVREGTWKQSSRSTQTAPEELTPTSKAEPRCLNTDHSHDLRGEIRDPLSQFGWIFKSSPSNSCGSGRCTPELRA